MTKGRNKHLAIPSRLGKPGRLGRGFKYASGKASLSSPVARGSVAALIQVGEELAKKIAIPKGLGKWLSVLGSPGGSELYARRFWNGTRWCS